MESSPVISGWTLSEPWAAPGGPVLAVFDVNGDGLDDVVTGTLGKPGAFWLAAHPGGGFGTAIPIPDPYPLTGVAAGRLFSTYPQIITLSGPGRSGSYFGATAWSYYDKRLNPADLSVAFGSEPLVLAAMGRFNDDSLPDLGLATSRGFAVYAQTPYQSLGSGFGVTGNGGGGFVGSDVNRDGHVDLVYVDGSDLKVMNGTGSYYVLGPTFSIGVNGGAAPWSLVGWADVNGDGSPDAVLTSADAALVVMLQMSTGGFGAPYRTNLPHPAAHAAVADFDRDGYADVVVPSGLDSAVLFLRGRGNGTFDPPRSFPVLAPAVGIAAGDFNGDGVLDLVAGSESGGLSVLFGRCP